MPMISGDVHGYVLPPQLRPRSSGTAAATRTVEPT